MTLLQTGSCQARESSFKTATIVAQNSTPIRREQPMPYPTTIDSYYGVLVEEAKKEINSTSDDRVLGTSENEWVEYLEAKFGMSPIAIDPSRQIEMVEVDHEYTLRRDDFYTGQSAGTRRRETAISIEVAVVPSDTIQAIWKHKLAPNPFSMSHPYPPFEYDHRAGLFKHRVQPNAAEVSKGVQFIQKTVEAYNVCISNQNANFRPQLQQLVTERRKRVTEKHKSLDSLAAAVGIPLRKKADPATVVPIAPTVKPTIVPVLPPTPSRQTRPVLEGPKFDAILHLIDNSGRQFERTPQAFSALTEEGLRDVLLSNLNAVFEGAAGGETFQGAGKCDIHLRISQGEVFVAELKFWTGPQSLKEVIAQLRARLTWRDAYGVAIMLARAANFTEAMTGVRATIPQCEGFVGSVTSRGENHSVARFTLTSDDGRQATIHVLVYNLFSGSAGVRMVKKPKSRPRV